MTRPGGLGFDLLCLAAGLALPLAFAPWSLYPLAWVALIPLFAVSEAPGPGLRFRRGLWFGLGQFGFGLYWLLPTIHTFGHMPLVLAVPTWVLLVAYCALYPALFALLGGWLGGPAALRFAAVLPLLWVGLEALRGWAFTGFPWLSLGASQAPGPLAGWLPVAGSLGTGLVLAVVNGLVLLAGRGLAHRRWLVGAVPLLAVAALAGAGSVAAGWNWTRPDGPAVEAALVQGNVPQGEKWDAERRGEILGRYERLTRAHLDADLVVWPETAVPLYADRATGYLNSLATDARARGSTLLVGVPEREWVAGRQRFYNSVLALGAHQGRYRKRHLVPFGEYVPLSSVLFFAERFVPGGGTFVGGDSAEPLALGGYRAGLSICYEDAFPREVAATVHRGATLLVNVTNDAWFGRSIGPAQHAQLARVRAREMGRPMLRVANTGLTFATDHTGRALAAIPPDQAGVAEVQVRPRAGVTPYQVLARGWLSGGLALALVVAAAFLWRGPLPRRFRR
ncbi:apolipoprotein N-acyltransferase [Thiohalorhabdus sp.]|uniref:apolipoprotein N-acyltransferase n=1 Tax=Thiohalorhabdus sp. TaxID=3094134 RepID=UPI002FC39B40